MSHLVKYTNKYTKKEYICRMSDFERIEDETPYARLIRAAIATINKNLSYEEFRLCADDCLVFNDKKDKNRPIGTISPWGGSTSWRKLSVKLDINAEDIILLVNRFIRGEETDRDKEWAQNWINSNNDHLTEQGIPRNIELWKYMYCDNQALFDE